MLKSLKTITNVLGMLKKGASLITVMRKSVAYFEAVADVIEYTINRISAVENPSLLNKYKKVE